MNTGLMVRDDSGLRVEFTSEAMALRESALAQSGIVARVSNAAENDAAVAAQTELRRVLKLCEDSRKAVKEPVLEFGRAIDDAARRFKDELLAEELRVARLAGDFQQLELARVRAAEAARQTELQAVERVRQEELARAQSIDEMTRINEAAAQKALDLPLVSPVRANGQVVREDWDIVVMDVHALYRAHPRFVTLTPRLSEIRQALDDGLQVPGVTASKVPKSGVRLPPERKAIYV